MLCDECGQREAKFMPLRSRKQPLAVTSEANNTPAVNVPDTGDVTAEYVDMTISNSKRSGRLHREGHHRPRSCRSADRTPRQVQEEWNAGNANG